MKKVTAYSLINDRDEMRLNPPDILLTNYKMLDQLVLRRLGLMLKQHQPDGFLGEYASNPLGRVTPVATSATLGGDDDRSKVLEFAGTIFGEAFTPDALVSEKTLTFSRVGTSEHRSRKQRCQRSQLG